VPLVENWNGTSWTVANGPSGAGSFLLGVSCTSPGACSAVGAGDAAVGPSGKVIRNEGVAFAAALAGAEWTVNPAQNAAGPSTATVAGVSCSAGSACTAVGSYSSHAGELALTERWDGTTWTTQPSAPQASGQIMLESVACPSAADCIAVGADDGPAGGNSKDTTFSERWDGTHWTVRPTASISEDFQSAVLSSVSCTSDAACTAIGTIAGSDGNPVPLLERWDGQSWTRQAAPNPNGTTVLAAVSCPSAAMCIAVGSTEVASSGHSSPVAERWDGTGWTAQTIASGAGITDIFLSGVSCPSAAFCVAVGTAQDQAGSSPIALASNGTTYTPLPTPPGGGSLEAVACRSSTFCLATGQTAAGDHTLAERWDGTAWSVQATPDRPGGSESGLHSISCATLYACMAVGEFYPATGVRGPLADRYTDAAPPPQGPPPPPAKRHASALLTEPPAAVCRTAFRWVLHRRSGKLRLSGRLGGSFSVFDGSGRVVAVSFARRRYAFSSHHRTVVRLSGAGQGMVVTLRRARRIEFHSRDGRLRLLVGRPQARVAVVHGESCWPMWRGDLTVEVLRRRGLRLRLLGPPAGRRLPTRRCGHRCSPCEGAPNGSLRSGDRVDRTRTGLQVGPPLSRRPRLPAGQRHASDPQSLNGGAATRFPAAPDG
jgi:hypothetical protein